MQESKICVKPVYKFIDAYAANENIPEFCLIYSEADDPEEMFISVNSENPDKFDEVLRKYKKYNFIFHGENGKGELCESFYFDGKTKKHIETELNLRLLTFDDKKFAETYDEEDGFLNGIFKDHIENKYWSDCGIIGAYDKHNNFTGYLAYYEIAENIRDVAYIYVGEKYRGKGCGKDLLNFFANKNTEENKISYYSYADGEISEKLVKSCGFLPCAKRTEVNI